MWTSIIQQINRNLPNFHYDDNAAGHCIATVKHKNVDRLCEQVLYLEGDNPSCRNSDTMEVFFDLLINPETQYLYVLQKNGDDIEMLILKEPHQRRYSERLKAKRLSEVSEGFEYFYTDQ